MVHILNKNSQLNYWNLAMLTNPNLSQNSQSTAMAKSTKSQNSNNKTNIKQFQRDFAEEFRNTLDKKLKPYGVKFRLVQYTKQILLVAKYYQCDYILWFVEDGVYGVGSVRKMSVTELKVHYQDPSCNEETFFQNIIKWHKQTGSNNG